MLPPAHIEYFNDLLDLKPGEDWEPRLYEEIDRCDLFLLFWSNAARQSEWVRREVDYVLKRKGDNDYSLPELWPIIIEGPPIAEPWVELSHLHMNDSVLYVLASSDPQMGAGLRSFSDSVHIGLGCPRSPASSRDRCNTSLIGEQ
jgi:hypothetical protein